MDAAGITCSQGLGDLVAGLQSASEERGRGPLGSQTLTGGITLERLEAVVDAAGIAPSLEALLPVGVRPRQLGVRTLLLGMLLTQVEHRPAHLSRIHAALVGLGDADRRRLGVVVD
jgi:hypothetical protein